MESLERAIRLAFDKGDPGDAEYRKRVYRSALNALEKSLAGSPGIQAEDVSGRRHALHNAIRRIESEFQPAVEPVSPDDHVLPQDTSSRANGEVAGGYPYAEPERGEVHDFGAALEPPPAPKTTERPKNRILGLPFFIGSAIVVAGAAYLFSLYGDNSSAPPRTAEQGSGASAPAAGGASTDAREWVDIFSAADPSRVTASPGIELEVIGENEDKYLRVNAKGSKTAAIEFEVGPGVLRQIAGKAAFFDILARGQEGKPVQIAVECNFGALGGCGRHRYEIQFQPFSYLLEISVPDGMPEAAGKIVMTPDTAGSGGYIDIRQIRVTSDRAGE